MNYEPTYENMDGKNSFLKKVVFVECKNLEQKKTDILKMKKVLACITFRLLWQMTKTTYILQNDN